MRMNLWMSCVAISLAFAATVQAQPNGGGGGRGGRDGTFEYVRGGFGLVGIAANEAVQADLGLSGEAAAKVKALSEEYNATVGEAMNSTRRGIANQTPEERAAGAAKRNAMIKTATDDSLPKLKELLTADQFTRLKQINWQSKRIDALSDPEIINAIPLSKEQQEKIQSIKAEFAAKRSALVLQGDSGGGGAGREEFAKLGEQNVARDGRIVEVLTKAQLDKFASLKGKEFDLSKLPPFSTGGGGPVVAGGGARGGPGGIGNFIGVGAGIVGAAANEAVQKELELSEDATGTVKSILEECNIAIRDAVNSMPDGLKDMRGMTREERAMAMEKRAATKKAAIDPFVPKLKEVLTADQFTRLKQIHWQSMGTAALSEAEVVKALSISKEQQETIESITTEYGAKRADLYMTSDNRIEPSEFAKRMMHNTEVDRERDAKINKVLTNDQQDKFASLKGKEFDRRQLLSISGGGGPIGGIGNGGRPRRPQTEAE